MLFTLSCCFLLRQLGWHNQIPLNIPEVDAEAQADYHDGDEGQGDPACRLHICPNESDHLFSFRAGGLFQENLVDCWAAAEQSRLEFLRFNQDKLRDEVYKSLADVGNNMGEPAGA